MGTFYVIYGSISPNTASGNRFRSFIRGFDELEVDSTAILLQPSKSHYKIDMNLGHIKIEYLWKDWIIARKVFDKLYRHIGLRLFLSRIKKGDIVFCFGTPYMVAKLASINGIMVFHERTESPDILPLSSPDAQSSYLEACTRIDGLFVISTALKQYFLNKGVHEDRIRIVNMTVDYKRFEILQKTSGVDKYIAYCGTVSNNKDGVDELIKSFALVVRRHADIKLYIIGANPSASDEAGNLKLIEDLGIKEKVVFTGIVASEKMPQLLKDASILALNRPDSLQAQNGFPTKLGEYLMTGNPVVVTAVGDIPLFLKDGESALLAEQRNPQSFASKLCWVLEHPIEAAEIGHKGKQVALSEFNYITESKKIIDFIYGKYHSSR